MNLQPMNKYHNKKTEVDGIIFDSKKEANRYIELKMLERAGKIHDLQLQVKLHLLRTEQSQFQHKPILFWFSFHQGKEFLQ